MTKQLCIASLLILLSLATKSVAEVFQPPGLNPGDTYQLIFVTAGSRDAQSPDIADYHAFVQAQAELNPSLTGTGMGVTYSAVASAYNDANYGARDNAVVSSP